jgi:SOS-response transcriptional repressor LexA
MTAPAHYPPTERQGEALRFIFRFQRENGGVSPSLREIAFALGVGPGNGSVKVLLDRAVERGLIRRLAHRARAIQLTPAALRFVVPPVSRAPDGAPLFFVPVRSAPDGR